VITETQAQDIIGSTAYGSDGEKLGSVGQVFLDDATGQPEFVTVNTGLFGMKESFIPVAEATFDGGSLTLPYTKDKVKGAPNVDVDAGHIDQTEEDELYRYYGLGSGTGYTETVGTGEGFATTGTETGVVAEGHDTSGPNTDDAMTRSEERVDVGTTTQEAGRVRLRKYVTTEM
jgi:sporulation protein YlmC with PRC-barrel domain